MIASTQTNHPLTGIPAMGDAATSAPRPIETATARLKAAGLRITQPRIAILESMIRRGQPATIEQIHAELSADSCDLVTVYRCLAVFEELGLVRRSFFHNGTSLYEINLAGTNRYHVISKDSNQVEEIDGETTAILRQAVSQVEETLRARGFTEVSHVVEFFGVSPQGGRINAAAPTVPTVR